MPRRTSAALLAAAVLAVGGPAVAAGSPRAAATCTSYGAIGDHWRRLGGATSLLGPCVTDEAPAVDVNPVQNPYVRGGTVLPAAGHAFLDRSGPALGGVRAGGAAVRAFAAEGWGWGGTWSSSRDYQHFSRTGR